MPLFGKGSSTKNAAKHRARTQSNLGTVEHMRAHDSFFALDMVDLGLANLDVAVTDRDRAAADAQQGTGAGGVAFRRASTANTYRRHSSVDHGAYYYEKMDAPRRATLRYGYEASAPGQISLPEGAVVDVIEGDAAADFWSVRCLLDGREGLCQRDYLEEMGKETLWELPPGALVIDGVADAADAGSLGSLKVAVALGSVAGGSGGGSPAEAGYYSFESPLKLSAAGAASGAAAAAANNDPLEGLEGGGNGGVRGRSKSTYRQHASVDLGVYYYQDTATGETVWEVPQGAEVIAEMAEGDEEAEGAAAAAAAEAAAAKEKARAMKAAGEVTDKKLRVRATIIDEIISTETTFVAGLSTLCEVYIKTLCTDKKLIKGGDVDTVFGGAQHLHGLNAKILIDLKAAAKMHFGDMEDASAVSGRVASVFARFAPYFKIFSTYVNNHANALLMLKTLKEKKKFVTALDLCNKEEGCMMGVESFLIMPVQRIPRYVLLLREMLRHTSKSHAE